MQHMNFLNLFNNSINAKEILQYLPDAVFIVKEDDGKILQVNDKAARIFEMEKEELQTFNFNSLVIKGMELANQSSRKDVPVIGAATLNREEFFVELNATLFEDMYLISIRDVTTMTNVLINAEKTGKLNKDKNIMLLKLANDFKSPLQSIMGFSQALTDGLGGDINEKQNKYVGIINKNASYLYDLMTKFFEFSVAESSLFDNKNQIFNIGSLIQSVIKSFDSKITGKDLVINFDVENPANKNIYSNAKCLKTILHNILELSVNLTEVGTITFDLSNPEVNEVEQRGVKLIKNANAGSYLQITVSDNGIGLKEQELEDIFEPYSQVDKMNKKHLIRTFSMGTVYELVKRLNGAIWIDSEIMKGTSFNIIIPIEKGAVSQDE